MNRALEVGFMLYFLTNFALTEKLARLKIHESSCCATNSRSICHLKFDTI